MPRRCLENETFSQSAKRAIDRATLVNMLEMVQYETVRTEALEALGICDDGNPIDILFDYVLDALGVPPNDELVGGIPFQRLDLETIFYSEYLLDGQWESLSDVLDALTIEAEKVAKQWQSSE